MFMYVFVSFAKKRCLFVCVKLNTVNLILYINVHLEYEYKNFNFNSNLLGKTNIATQAAFNITQLSDISEICLKRNKIFM